MYQKDIENNLQLTGVLRNTLSLYFAKSQTVRNYMSQSNSKIEILKADITKIEVDVIVNAANTSLLGGGGVDGAIHRAAGSELKEFCKTLGGCKVGEAKLSPAFNLPSKFIIHTVGPRFLFKNEEEIQDLKNCYLNSLKIVQI